MLKRNVEIIGVPSDIGANIRGTSLGPIALRVMGLKKRIEELGHRVIEYGDLKIAPRSFDKVYGEHNNLALITELCYELLKAVKESLDKGHIPLILGGDHSIAIGSVSGVAAHFKEAKKKLGLIWVDAHADYNTPLSSPTGNIHGMALSCLLGRGHDILVNVGPHRVRLNPNNVALIGIRLIDELEKELLRSSGINYFSMHDIDQIGMGSVMDQAIRAVSHNTDAIHLSFDLDALDPHCAPGVSTPVTGGINMREARLLLERTYQSQKLASIEFVELNPLSDVNGKTTELCIELIQTALGRTII
jgi:arginase